MFRPITFFICLNTVLLLFVPVVNGRQYISHTASLINEMKIEVKKIDQKLEKVTSVGKNYQETINRLTTECSQIAEKVSRKQNELKKSADKNLVELAKLHPLIGKEEEEHSKLESEFTSYTQLLELWKLKHDVVMGDLKQISNRRRNGTSDRCRSIITELAEEEGLKVKTRTAYWAQMSNKKQSNSVENAQFNIQQRELKRKDSDLKRMLTLVEISKKRLEKEQEFCERARKQQQRLFGENSHFLSTSVSSVTVLRSDLSTAQTYSKQLRLKIETVRKLIGEWRAKVIELMKSLTGFREDKKCYAKFNKYT